MEIKVMCSLGALMSLSLIILFQTFLVKMARKQAGANRDVRFMDLIITCEDESYSLSRLQMYVWTVVIIVGYGAVFFSTPGVPFIPESLYILMGINFANSVASTAINTYKSTPPPAAPPLAGLGAGPAAQPAPAPQPAAATPPDFIKDIFFESAGSLDLPRTQMFIWTVVSVGVFIVMLVNSFGSTPKLTDISNGLVALMGISNGAYLGAKAAKK
jgi:hypothetical protein